MSFAWWATGPPANFPKRTSLSCAHEQFGGREGGEHPTSRLQPLLIYHGAPRRIVKVEADRRPAPQKNAPKGSERRSERGRCTRGNPYEVQRGACPGVCREGD